MNEAVPPRKRRVRFQVRAQKGSEVYLAGTFNNWDPKAKRLKDKDGSGLFTGTLLLPPGRYEYKFVIDGTWCVDPECPEWVPNDMGTLNSVLHVE
ncbi:MAG: glycogen-binding domain-containing protein [Kiritimatiellae bacterium]|nr:glycogen-binding domain-containing protein [Kiritimatiellia bacterium]